MYCVFFFKFEVFFYFDNFLVANHHFLLLWQLLLSFKFEKNYTFTLTTFQSFYFDNFWLSFLLELLNIFSFLMNFSPDKFSTLLITVLGRSIYIFHKIFVFCSLFWYHVFLFPVFPYATLGYIFIVHNSME